MNIERIMAFGCSITYGEGLIDAQEKSPDLKKLIHEGMPPKSSKYAWPAALGVTLDCDVKNFGYPGTSNKNICNIVIQQKYKKNDIAVILWTNFSRTTFNTEKNKWFDIGPHSLATRKKTKSSIFYKHLYYDFNQNIENYSAINFAKLYLDSKGVKNYHFIWTTIPLEHMEVPQWNSVDIQYINIRDSENPNYIHLDYACDDMHPGPQTQNLIAYTMYNTILND